MERVAARCIKDNRDKRYASADDVADALRPRSVVPLVVVSAFVVLAVLGGFGWWRASGIGKADVVWLHDTLTVHTSDTVYINKVETVMQHSTSPIEAFNSDSRLAHINEMARSTTLRMMSEAYAIYTDTTQPLEVRLDAMNRIHSRIETAIRKEVDATVDPSLPEHSLYLNAAISLFQVTMRDFSAKHSWAMEQ